MYFKINHNIIFKTGPVRLFVPYKRKKRDSDSGPSTPTIKKLKRATGLYTLQFSNVNNFQFKKNRSFYNILNLFYGL